MAQRQRQESCYRDYEYAEVAVEQSPPPHLPERPASTDGGEASSASDKYAVVRASLVGRLEPFTTPFGRRPLVYTDWTATGRSLGCIESYLQTEVMPLYGNTHTTSSITGLQSTCFRSEARQIIAEACNAKVTGRAAEDVVLFAGSGATAAVCKLVSALGLQPPASHAATVLVGPHEHHSNLLPWRESGAKVVAIREAPDGGLDLADLEARLREISENSRKAPGNREKYGFGGASSGGSGGGGGEINGGATSASASGLVVGAFSAASNVTGILADVDRVTALLHSYGALACWDFAAAAPYVKVDMNPFVLGDQQTLVYKDAVFFSGHKFVGGPGSPGVLVVKKRLLANAVPTAPGGGTVFWVTPDDHRFLSNREEREEGGTPDVLGAVRLGLAMQLKQRIGPAASAAAAASLASQGLAALRNCPNLVLLGDDAGQQRLPIFSFLVRAVGGGGGSGSGSGGGGGGAIGGVDGRFLHYNFVCALLNDLFGVQARGGCQCAAPFGMALLGLRWPEVRALEASLLRKQELLRPGWVRLSLTPYNSPAEVNFVLRAVEFISSRGSSFLPQYRADPRTGQWKHASRLTRFPERRWLGRFDYGMSAAAAAAAAGSGPGSSGGGGGASTSSSSLPVKEAGKAGELEGEEEEALFARLLTEAEALADAADAAAALNPQGARPPPEELLDDGAEQLRWFVYPWETPELTAAAAAPAAEAAAANGRREAFASGDNGGTLAVIDPRRYYDSRALGSEPGRDSGPLPLGDAERTMAAAAEAMATESSSAAPAVASAAAAAEEEEERKGSSSESEFEGSTDSTGTHSGGAGGDAAAQSEENGSTTPETVITAGAACSIRRRRGPQPDDNHKYPLRRAGDGSSGGVTGESYSETVSLAAAAGGGSSASVSVSVSEQNRYRLQALQAQAQQKSKRPPRALLRPVGQAIRDWNMIEDGDRLLLGLSGGKDSLSLLHVLLWLQKRAPVRFDIACATVDPQTPSYDPSPLIPYVESLGLKMHFLSDAIVQRAADGALQGDSLCAFCARAKRGLLYSCCRDNGYNKLVLGQHLDDLAESFLMSAMHNGQLRTMKANYVADDGGVRVIRPLAYAREAATKAFAREARLPVVNENCPACFEQPKERRRVKKLLAREEALFPQAFPNMRAALLPLMAHETYADFRAIRTEIDARGIRVKAGPEVQARRRRDGNGGSGGGSGGGGTGGGGTGSGGTGGGSAGDASAVAITRAAAAGRVKPEEAEELLGPGDSSIFDED